MRDHVKMKLEPAARARDVLMQPGAHATHVIRNAALYLMSHSKDESETAMCRALVTAVDRRPIPTVVTGIHPISCALIAVAFFALGAGAVLLAVP